MEKLDKDWVQLTAFFDFPAEHWRHLRTTNPIGHELVTDVLDGVSFKDGVKVEKTDYEKETERVAA